MTGPRLDAAYDGNEIAVIGMACRFPGARTVEGFWRNLCAGVESLTVLADDDLRRAGVEPALASDPLYVRRVPILDDIESFDAGFFGYTPLEARLMDPQHRLFLECAWETFERAGYNPESYPSAIGVFTGAKTNTYLFNLFTNRDVFRSLDAFQIALGNDLACLATRVSYKLNLRGPSYALHTACSTSLIAVHLASQSLLLGECRMALAGGVAINVPHRRGYLFQKGGILSPDGSCRTFDAQAAGSNFGNGVGAVLLKRLEDARADGDHIHAIIRGSAANNDGAEKASYTAPGVEGQARVLLDAMACAGIGPDSLSYIEAHGTATELGDSIEMLALMEAFRAGTSRRSFCAIGSVKTNLGHLETAAGIAGLMKTALALEHGQIPPSLHFVTPSRRIDFDHSPFYVNTQLAPWEPNGGPRRAGVSSFGIGSTNAHVILEEPPEAPPPSPSLPWQLLVWSARSAAAADALTRALGESLQRERGVSLADVAYTLAVGRKEFGHRRAAVCRDAIDAAAALASGDPLRVLTQVQCAERPALVFLFPGLGEHYAGVGAGLYRSLPVFRAEVDRCAELLASRLGLDLRDVLFAGAAEDGEEVVEEPDLRRMLRRANDGADGTARAALSQTGVAQPGLFVVEYALARQWMAWGMQPRAMIGYSLGEYVAACLAEVLTLPDALLLVAERARRIAASTPGAMVAVPLGEAELAPLLVEHGLSLAAIDAPSVAVGAGSLVGVEALERALGERGVVSRRLATSHAFHSTMLEPLGAELTKLVRGVERRPPKIPYISNVTGTWITPEQATDAAYWARHMCQTVRLLDGYGELLGLARPAFVELGPGQGLTSFLRLHPACDREVGQRIVPAMRAGHARDSDLRILLAALGGLWAAGVSVDWPAFWANERRRRTILPTYPFERQRHWVEAQFETLAAAPPMAAGLTKRQDPADWFYLPIWRELGACCSTPQEPTGAWVVLADRCGIGSHIVRHLTDAGAAPFVVGAGRRFERIGRSEYTVRPGVADDLRSLLKELARRGEQPRRFVHLWSVTESAAERGDEELFRQAQETGFYSLIALGQVLGEPGRGGRFQIDVVSTGLHEVTGAEALAPEKSTVLGACTVLSQEYPSIFCRSIDLGLMAGTKEEIESVAKGLLADLLVPVEDRVVAHRAGRRYVLAYEPSPLAAAARPPFRQGGVYLITGGLGGIGLVLARHLATTVRARLVLTRRAPLPDLADWEDLLADATGDEETRRLLRAIRELEALGAEVLVAAADVADADAMHGIVAAARRRFGTLHGVIHAAGLLDPTSFKTLQQTTRVECERHFQAKVYGLYVLERALAGVDLDFCLLFSSLSAILGGLGYVAYASANLFMDHFARRHNRTGGPRWISVDWDSWQHRGVRDKKGGIGVTLVELAFTPEEGIEALGRILAADRALQPVVSVGELQPRIDQWVRLKGPRPADGDEPTAIASPRQQPGSQPGRERGELAGQIAAIWERLLGRRPIGHEENFFDLGGNSLLGMQLVAELNRELGVEVTPVALFEAPTVAALARLFAPDPMAVEAPSAPERPARGGAAPGEIAVIGMVCRLPGASDTEEFWQNLCNRRETISFFSGEELLAAGVPPEDLADPRYVRARPILEDVDLFDARFFGYSARDAELMDPQHRIFLESAWEALENAGHDAERSAGRIGVYAGASISAYMYNLYSNPDLVKEIGTFPILIGNEKDSVTTKVSYKLNLRGPSLAVQTFCSTSLVAVHLACQGLLNGDCDMALAGGVSVILPQKSGYLYQEGGIGSKDGHIRAFDAKASGIVFGNGLGIVVLKRLADALADGDQIRAVIKGSAVNNDGSFKAGYTATSVEGQAEVVRAALETAGVDPETVGYMEAHGTGTPLGDPIEVAALTRAFRRATERRSFCPLGSVKTNVGHLDRAAGVTGLIKTVLALERRMIPASLYFEEPSPNIDFAGCPFFVNTELTPWEANGAPRRAGVNSLGLGGTNAHVILEEAPEIEPSGPSRPWQLFVLSAQSSPALERATHRLADHLRSRPDLELADVAFTLQVGRKAMARRRVLVCQGREDALEALVARDPRRVFDDAQREPAPVASSFLFPGLGGQYVGMAAGLYRDEPIFRRELDRCAEILTPLLGLDLREVIDLRGGDGGESQAAGPAGEIALRRMLRRGVEGGGDERLHETWLAHPALFAIEYSLARVWMGWGVQPRSVAGYSIGEYAAACIAGVFTLDDALMLVARRARMIQALPPGAMLAVPLGEEQIRPLLGDRLSLAALNGPQQSVVAGPPDEIAACGQRLAGEGIVCRTLTARHAFHSWMMEPLLGSIRDLVGEIPLRPPSIPFLSNVTGTWMTAEEAVDPSYWARHMGATVRFSDCVRELLAGDEPVLVEMGPGQVLGSLVLQQSPADRPLLVAGSLRHSYEIRPDSAYLLEALGKVWAAGVVVDWPAFHAGERRLRVVLPTYPFERQRYWIEPGQGTWWLSHTAGDRSEERFYASSWKRSLAVGPTREDGDGIRGPCLIFRDTAGLGTRLAARLAGQGCEVLQVEAGGEYRRVAEDLFTIDPRSRNAYLALLAGLARPPRTIVHLWTVAPAESAVAEPAPAAWQRLGFDSLLFIGDALASRGGTDPVALWVVTRGLQEVNGEEAVRAEWATLFGPCRLLPQRLPNLACCNVDLLFDPACPRGFERLADQLWAEICSRAEERIVAYRGAHRWSPVLDPLDAPAASASSPLRDHGVYLIIGELQNLAPLFAAHLERTVRARLVSVDSRGAGISAAIAGAHKRLGAIHGVIYLAAEPGAGGCYPVASQVEALGELAASLDDTVLDFVLLVSSAATGSSGLADGGAMSFLLSAVAASRREGSARWSHVSWDIEPGSTVDERVLTRLFALMGVQQIVVSRRDLAEPWEFLDPRDDAKPAAAATAIVAHHPRPRLRTEYVAPGDEMEGTIASIWADLLGVEEVGVHDSFLDLGGDSLLAARVLAKVRDAFGLDLPIRAVFEAATVAQLSRVVARARAESAEGEMELDEEDCAEMRTLLEGMPEDLVEAEIARRMEAASTGD